MAAASDKHTDKKTKNRLPKLNLNFLKEMSGGDSQFVIEILEIFISDAPLTLKSINSELAHSDIESVKISVHKLKSSIKVLGVDALAELAQQLENEAGKGKVSKDFKLKITKLEKCIEALVKECSIQIKYLKNQK
ncbi:MAG: Hpt domain-containing protein [Chitinophagales bacterium]